MRNVLHLIRLPKMGRTQASRLDAMLVRQRSQGLLPGHGLVGRCQGESGAEKHYEDGGCSFHGSIT
jgi:hypothetical protein